MRSSSSGWASPATMPVARKIFHPLPDKTRAGVVAHQTLPFLCAIPGLFDQFAFRGGQRLFAGFDAAGGQFQQVFTSGMAILAFENDKRVGGVGAVVHGKHNDGTVVPDDVARGTNAIGLLHVVRVDGEDTALKGER